MLRRWKSADFSDFLLRQYLGFEISFHLTDHFSARRITYKLKIWKNITRLIKRSSENGTYILHIYFGSKPERLILWIGLEVSLKDERELKIHLEEELGISLVFETRIKEIYKLFILQATGWNEREDQYQYSETLFWPKSRILHENPPRLEIHKANP